MTEPAQPRLDELAAALRTGPWTVPMIARRLGGWQFDTDRWARALAEAAVARWPQRPDDTQLLDWLQTDAPLQADEPGRTDSHWPGRAGATRSQQRFALVPAGSAAVAVLHGPADLARLLSLTEGELAWFADCQDRNRRVQNAPLQHYRYRWVPSHSGFRLLEIPKPRMKELQRRLGRVLISRIPLHPAAHGSVPGRSVASCVAPHAGSAVLVRCDLEGFFSAITAARVRGLLLAAGVEESLVPLVAGLVTTVTPVRVWRNAPPAPATGRGPLEARWRQGRRLAGAHLPQGAPSSPGLANAVALGLDHRLARLAESLDARYTRYVDDLIFSTDNGSAVGPLLAAVRQIVADEDFALAETKTAVLRSSRRQAALGTVLNARPGVARPELDRLRAIIHNCSVHGVASQARDRTVPEFRDWLQGTVAWVQSVDPGHGARLQRQLARLDWR